MRIRAKIDLTQLLTDDVEHPNLQPGEIYFVLGISAESYRIIDRSGDPILYPKALFEVIDPMIPRHWRFHEFADGAYYLDPALTDAPGFYERFFNSDGDLAAQTQAERALEAVLEDSLESSGPEDTVLLKRDLTRLSAGIQQRHVQQRRYSQ